MLKKAFSAARVTLQGLTQLHHLGSGNGSKGTSKVLITENDAMHMLYGEEEQTRQEESWMRTFFILAKKGLKKVM